MTLLTLALLGTPAFAQDDAPEPETPAADAPSADEQTDLDRAVELFNNGKALFDEAAYTDAITAWEESYRLSKKPALLFNIASAHERKADFEGALEALNRYRAFAKPDEKEALDRRIRNLEKAAEEAEKNRAPDPSPVPVGPVEPEPKPGRGQRLAGAALIGVGVIGVGAGAGLGLASSSAGTRASDQCVDTDAGVLCPSTAKEDVDSNATLATAADGAMVAGLVLAGVGVAVLVTAPKAKLTVGPSSMTFSGRF